MEKLEIKVGEKTHLSGVLDLITELAIYEKAPNEVLLTVEQLEKDGFGDGKIFDFFVAIIDNKLVGMAIYFYKYSTWKGKSIYLEDLVVQESYRGKGIGAKLFEALISKAKEEKVQRLDWQVLDWNEPAINFYKKYNASLDEEWTNGRLVFEQIQNFGE